MDAHDASATPVVLACSGCSDVGEIADRAARQLAREGRVKMSCIAGVGGRVAGIVNPLRRAGRIIAIDGCPLQCARHSLAQAGFTDFTHVKLHELGLRKNQSPCEAAPVSLVVEAVCAHLDAPSSTGSDLP